MALKQFRFSSEDGALRRTVLQMLPSITQQHQLYFSLSARYCEELKKQSWSSSNVLSMEEGKKTRKMYRKCKSV